jgi:hypothetical protein
VNGYDEGRVLKLSYRGAPQTVTVMQRAVHEAQGDLAVRALCEEVCAGIDSKDYLSEYLAIYHCLLGRCRYMRDPRTVELVRSPSVVAREIMAGGVPSLDCDDEASLIGACVLAVGGQARIVTVAFRDMFYEGRRQFSHVFAEAFEPKTRQWITLDPVAAEKTKKMLADIRAAKVWPV